MTYNIKFKNLQITDLSLKIGSFDKKVTEKFETKFSFNSAFTSKNDKIFAIVYNLELNNQDSKFNLKIKATSHFETEEAITLEFRSSSFVKINAPAISFPYLRAFVANFTLNSGFEPIMLPTFNFVQMFQDLEKKKSEKLIKEISKKPTIKTAIKRIK